MPSRDGSLNPIQGRQKGVVFALWEAGGVSLVTEEVARRSGLVRYTAEEVLRSLERREIVSGALWMLDVGLTTYEWRLTESWARAPSLTKLMRLMRQRYRGKGKEDGQEVGERQSSLPDHHGEHPARLDIPGATSYRSLHSGTRPVDDSDGGSSG